MGGDGRGGLAEGRGGLVGLVLDLVEGFEGGWGLEVGVLDLAHEDVFCNKIKLGGLYYFTIKLVI